MNKKCTTFAILTEYSFERMQISVFRLHGGSFKRKDYILTLDCKGEIGLDISEDEVITLFGLAFGIRKYRIDHDRLIPILKAQLYIFEFPDITTLNGRRFSEANFHASVCGTSVLYSMLDGGSSSGWDVNISMIDFRDNEWTTVYNDTRLDVINGAKLTALTPQVALIYDAGHVELMTLMLLRDGEWQEVATHQKQPHSMTGLVKLSADGSFVAILKENGYFSLYSLTNSTG
jgi:hypothetical protein